jgi:8-demethyl-8-alpha-L-rhamnosyltetracenomycin-C 2'-O-methyltransferase
MYRAAMDDLTNPQRESASVTMEFTHRGHCSAFTISVGPERVEVRGRPAPDSALSVGPPSPVISQDLSEAAAALFGPRESVSAATRSIRWPGPEVVFPAWFGRPGLPAVFYAVVQRVLQVLDREEPADLTGLAVRYGTDKWSALHRYTPHYQRHLGPLRDRRLTVLEIGIGGFGDPAAGGRSLRMWKHYFPRAIIYGMDIEDKRGVDEPRLVTIQADQSDPEELARVAARFGPFDIIVDDGSHISSHVITTFRALFPCLRPNGLYIIEDLCTSYWPEVFNGSDSDLNDPDTTVGFLKTFLDGLHHEEFLRPDVREPQPTDAQINAIHFYHNMTVMEKRPNNEGSVVADVFRAMRRSQGR